MKSQSVLALEVEDYNLLAVEAVRRAESVKVLKFGRFTLPEGANGEGLGRAIRTVLRSNGFTEKKVAVLFSSEFVEHRLLDLPSVSGSKLAAIVKGQSMKDSRLAAIEQVQNQFCVLEEVKEKGKTKKRVFCTNFSQSELQNILLSMSEAGLKPCYATSASAALSQLALACSRDIGKGCKALLHIRGRQGHILIFDRKGWLFSREFKLAPGFSDDYAARSFGETEDPSEDEPWSSSSEDETASGGDGGLFADMAIDEINRSILYFKQNSRRMVDEILLACDDELGSELEKRIVGELGISAKNFDACENVDLSGLHSSPNQEAFALNEYLPLIALISAPESQICPNLIPSDFLERRARTAAKTILAVVALGLLSAGVVGYTALAYSDRTLAALLRQKQAYMETRRSRIENLAELMSRKKSFTKKELILKQSLAPQPPWAEMLRRVSLMASDELLLTRLSVERRGDGCWVSVSGEVRAASPNDAQTSFRKFCDEWDGSACFSQTVLEPVRLQIVENDSGGQAVEPAAVAAQSKYRVLFSMQSKLVGRDEAS